jgi:putative transposase
MDGLKIYRRDLPHWRLSGSTYWMTWRLHQGRRELPPEARDIVMAALHFRAGVEYELLAFVVMDDHVHVIVRPLGEHQLEKIAQSWKSVSAHRINRLLGWTGTVWEPEYMDRIIRTEDELHDKCAYVLNNPRKRWPEIKSYAWVYCRLLDDSATGDGARATT